ncbi:MAG: lactate dehydrogenase [Tistrella sp.]|nr:lactate dehydrogenase [Tistrella sp.]
MPQVTVEALRAFSNDIFTALDVSTEDAATITDVMIHADLRGHASHGTTRIPIYAERIKAGIVKNRPDIRFSRINPGFIRVDGNNGPGPVVTLAALEELLTVVRETGVAIAAIGHSNHNGTGSYYVERAIAAGCIAIAMTNAPPSMAVFGGREPVIGTNPITFGAPTTSESPRLLDMATLVVARGKIVEAAKRGEPIPEGWALNGTGRPTTDSGEAEAGVVLPMSGSKGSGLAIMVEVLSGVLSGGRFAGSLGNLYSDFETPQDIGHFLMLIDVSRDNFADRAGMLVAELKASATAEGFKEILTPGEIEQQRAHDKTAIALPPNVLFDLNQTAAGLGLEPLSTMELAS